MQDGLPTGSGAATPAPRTDSQSALFDAILRPHRSLSPTGFIILMSLVATVGFGAGITFLLIGAWPVFGFCGLEVVLLYVCFRLSYRGARIFERVRLTEGRLIVERWGLDGRVRQWSFQPYWLRVTIDDPPEPNSPLLLSSHGHSLAIGSFLTVAERLELARALRQALAARDTVPGA